MDYREIYRDNWDRINVLLESFSDNKDYIRELIFCICTPNTSFIKARNAAFTLSPVVDGMYLSEIVEQLNDFGISGAKEKALFIHKISVNMDLVYEFLSETMNSFDHEHAREHIYSSNYIFGVGFVEISHLIRNTGFSQNVAILDRYMLKKLKECGVISSIPHVLDIITYGEIEISMGHYAKELNMSVAELDFVLRESSKWGIVR